MGPDELRSRLKVLLWEAASWTETDVEPIRDALDDAIDSLSKAQALADAALLLFSDGGLIPNHWCRFCARVPEDKPVHKDNCPWEAYRVWRASHGDLGGEVNGRA